MRVFPGHWDRTSVDRVRVFAENDEPHARGEEHPKESRGRCPTARQSPGSPSGRGRKSETKGGRDSLGERWCEGMRGCPWVHMKALGTVVIVIKSLQDVESTLATSRPLLRSMMHKCTGRAIESPLAGEEILFRLTFLKHTHFLFNFRYIVQVTLANPYLGRTELRWCQDPAKSCMINIQQ